jgi:drug/metabolite transporter (DMT)-like permease
MAMSATAKAYWQIHFCVLLWGFTAIIGKLITLSALALVWWRMLLVILALALVPTVWRGLRALSPRLLAAYAFIGVLVALHWLTFYGSIKLANASVAASCMATASVFLAVIEPWLAGKRFELRELLLGIAVIPGVALVVGGVPPEMRLGIAVGVLSAILVAFFGALNKRLVERADPLTVTFIELAAGTAFLTLIAPLLVLLGWAGDEPLLQLPDLRDSLLLLLLAFACTLFPFALSLIALRHMSAFGAQLAVNLEPVYAVALAIVLLNEQLELTATFYVGVAIILAATLLHPLISRREPHPPVTEVLATAESKHIAD